MKTFHAWVLTKEQLYFTAKCRIVYYTVFVSRLLGTTRQLHEATLYQTKERARFARRELAYGYAYKIRQVKVRV